MQFCGERISCQGGVDAPACATAPPDTKAECELEVAHLLALQEKYPEAERAYGAWLAAYGSDERAEGARYWRALCLKEVGREAEAETVAAALAREARQEAWRGPAALLAASLMAARNDRAAAAKAYAALAVAPWGAPVRPQALLGAAKTAATVEVSRKFCRDLIRTFPDAAEAEAARELLHEPKHGGSRFGVQVGAYQKEANAKAEKAKWTKVGRKADIVRRDHASLGRLYFVILGPFPSFDAAVSARDAVRASGATAQITSY